jgi:Outer membrane lipoprotein-sorting protein
VRALKFHLGWLFTAVLLSGGALRAEQPATPDLKQIVSNMETARVQSKQTEPFLLTREYRLFHGDEVTPTSEVKAEINVVPPHERDYKIVESKGSDRGEKVVRKILDHESEAEKRSVPPTALVSDNYDFGFLGEQSFQGAHCYVLSLHPKRKDPSLIEGKAWVDASTFLVRKVEGAMSKSPSWWVKDVTVTVLFGEISGVWTQTATNAVANVRIMGKYTVSGRSTSLLSATAEASNRVQKKVLPRARRNAPGVVLYPGVLVTR